MAPSNPISSACAYNDHSGSNVYFAPLSLLLLQVPQTTKQIHHIHPLRPKSPLHHRRRDHALSTPGSLHFLRRRLLGHVDNNTRIFTPRRQHSSAFLVLTQSAFLVFARHVRKRKKKRERDGKRTALAVSRVPLPSPRNSASMSSSSAGERIGRVDNEDGFVAFMSIAPPSSSIGVAFIAGVHVSMCRV